MNEKKRILIVEDEMIEAVDMKNHLTKHGYDVTAICTNADDALEKTETLKPDIVLMDIIIQGDTDGIEAAEQIRMQYDIPVVFITSYYDEKRIIRAKRSEAYGYVLKPFEVNDLVIAVELALHRHKIEYELRKSEEKFRLLFEGSHDLISICDKNAIPHWANPAWKQIFGPVSDYQVDPFDNIHPDDLDIVSEAWAALVDKNINIDNLLYRYRDPMGNYRTFESSAYPARMDDESIYYVIARDVTARKQAEDSLQQTTEKLQRLLDASPAAILVTDPEGHLMQWNPAAERMFGWSKSEVLGKRNPTVPPELLGTFDQQLDQLQKTGQIFDAEIKPIAKDGSTFDMLLSAAPLLTPDGGLDSIITIMTDITERKISEEKLRKSEQKFRNLFDANMIGVGYWNLQGDITDCNDKFLDIIGYPRKDLVAGKVRWKDLTPAEHTPLDQKALLEIERQGYCEPYEKEYTRKDGTRIPILIGGAIIEGAPDGGVTWVLDITEKKKAEIQAANYREELQNLSKRLMHSQEEERQKISQELHDELGQMLTALAINLSSVSEALPSGCSEKITERIKDSTQIIDNMSDQLHRMILELRPSMLDDLGLTATLRWYIKQFQKRTQIKVDIRTNQTALRASKEIETVLYRIAQEALTNTARHANAKHIRMSVNRRKTSILMVIEDDGQGFDLKAAEQHPVHTRGTGLLGMRERLSTVDGALEIRSGQGKGTRLKITVPIGDKA